MKRRASATYGGHEESETLERMKRLETRMTSFMVWWGFDPTRNLAKGGGGYMAPHVVDGAIHVPSPNSSIGDVMMTALKHHMTGEIDVYVAGRKFMTFDTEAA